MTFAGEQVPNLEIFEEFTSYELDLKIHYGLVNSRSCNDFVPVSTSFIDPSCHPCQLTTGHVKLMDNALSKNGSYPRRNVTVSRGHCSYFGLKKKRTRARATPSPNNGPGMHEYFQLYRRYMDARYIAHSQHLVNELAYATYLTGRRFCPHLDLLEHDKDDMLLNSRIKIYTRNFANQSHMDSGDAMLKENVDEALRNAQQLLSHQFLSNACRKRIINCQKICARLWNGITNLLLLSVCG